MSLTTNRQEKSIKPFIKAPLPFMGQKRNFLNHFKEVLKDYPEDATYVDLFGGSGLLSHTVRNYYPKAKVVYNDYDNYQERLRNVSKTNKLLADLRIVLANHPRNKKIDGKLKELVFERLEREKGYIDFITLSSSLLFAMKYALNLEDFKKCTLYNTVRMSDYEVEGYLDDIEVVTADYKTLFHQYSTENVVFLLDPPYLSTEVGTYTMSWSLSDYLDVLDVLKGGKYFYFTSNKSSIIELCDWVANKTGGTNPFQDANKIEMKANVNHNASYTDIMLYKGWTSTITK